MKWRSLYNTVYQLTSAAISTKKNDKCDSILFKCHKYQKIAPWIVQKITIY